MKLTLDINLNINHKRDASIRALQKGVTRMAQELDRLVAAVERNTSVDQSAITLMTQLGNELRKELAAAHDLEDLQGRIAGLADRLESDNQRIADAVVANTPAQPTTPTEPTPPAVPADRDETVNPVPEESR